MLADGSNISQVKRNRARQELLHCRCVLISNLRSAGPPWLGLEEYRVSSIEQSRIEITAESNLRRSETLVQPESRGEAHVVGGSEREVVKTILQRKTNGVDEPLRRVKNAAARAKDRVLAKLVGYSQSRAESQLISLNKIIRPHPAWTRAEIIRRAGPVRRTRVGFGQVEIRDAAGNFVKRFIQLPAQTIVHS